MTAKIELNHIYKNFGALPVLQDINLQVEVGEFVSLIGPSGCGKSTIFNLLSGLDKPDNGEICFDGKPVQPRRGTVALMPQRDSLLPWRTVLDNTIIALELHGVSKKEARQRALAQFETFGLKGFERNFPWQLSGGMRQRAAMLRTVLSDRDVLLLDEPFGALDALTRASLQTWLLQIWQRLQRTILFITHDVEEAILLSDKIYALSPRPSSVKLELPINLPRPRAVTNPAFVALKAQLLEALQ